MPLSPESVQPPLIAKAPDFFRELANPRDRGSEVFKTTQDKELSGFNKRNTNFGGENTVEVRRAISTSNRHIKVLPVDGDSKFNFRESSGSAVGNNSPKFGENGSIYLNSLRLIAEFSNNTDLGRSLEVNSSNITINLFDLLRNSDNLSSFAEKIWGKEGENRNFGGLNTADLKRLAKAKELVMGNIGLGVPRQIITESDLVSTVIRSVDRLNQLSDQLNQNDSTHIQDMQKAISNIVKDIDPKALAAFGVVTSGVLLASSKLKKKDLVQVTLLASMLLASCNPTSGTTSTPETQELPTPVVTVIRGEPSSTPEAPQATATQNFGLNGENGEWPGTGVNPVELVENLIEQGVEVKPSREMTNNEKQQLQEAGADITGLEQALNQKLTGNNTKELVISEAGGWAIEVRAEQDKQLKWSWITGEDGIGRWGYHPNLIPSSGNVEFKKVATAEGEELEIFVYQGTAIGILVNQEGQTIGVFNPLTGEIDKLASAQAAEVEPTTTQVEATQETKVPFWDESQIAWKQEFNDSSGQEVVSIEIQKSIYENPDYLLRGFTEAGEGSSERVVETFRRFKELLRNGEGNTLEVGVNMVAEEDGTFEYVPFDPNDPYAGTVEKIDEDTPLRVIFADSTKYPMRDRYTLNSDVSFGWFREPNTDSLVIVLSPRTSAFTPLLDDRLGEALVSIVGAADLGFYRVINASDAAYLSNIWFKDPEPLGGLKKETPLKPIFRDLNLVESIANKSLASDLGENWKENLLVSCGSDGIFVSLSQLLDSVPVGMGFGTSANIDNTCGVADYRRTDGKSLTLIGKSWDSSEESDELVDAFFSHIRGRVDEPVSREENRIVWKLKDGRTMELHIDGNQTIWIFSPDEVTAADAWAALNED